MTQALQPIPILLWCPLCHERHIDEGEFETKVHHTHSCQHCGMSWRPAIVPTVGVKFLPGFKNEEPQTQETPVTEPTAPQQPAPQPEPVLTPEQAAQKHLQEQQIRMRTASGNVTATEPIIAFLYVLLRDHLTPGKIEDIMVNHVPAAGVTTAYSNGWLAQYAADIGRRLLVPAAVPATPPQEAVPSAPAAPAAEGSTGGPKSE